MTQPQPESRNVSVTADLLERLNSATKGSGGFQSLAKKLLKQVQGSSLTVYPDDDERLERYAKEYKTGGWQTLFELLSP